jgi:hypothetical protein
MAVDQIFVYAVEDGRAECWTVELAVRALRQADAFRTLRDGGLRKSQFLGSTRPSRSMSLAELDDETLGPGGIARREFEPEGWTPWVPVPLGFTLDWRDSGQVKLHNPIGDSCRRRPTEAR